MNRSILYSGEQGRTFDQLWAWRDQLSALGNLELDLSGQTTTVVGGLVATPTSPASLGINLTAGRVYQQSSLDATTYGSLPADTDLVQQQGYADAQAVLLTTAALSAGQSQWALVEVQFSQIDVIRAGDPTSGVLYFFNSANPTQPLQGPGGNGQTLPTEREATISVKVLYGSPATTGSEVPPQPETGWIGLYLIDLAFGQTTITSGQILVAGPSVGANVPSNYPGAPFLAGLLNQHHLGIPGQAPKIDLTSEVKNLLPLSNSPASNTSGGGLPVMKLYAGNPNTNVAGNAGVNGASDFCWDTVDLLLFVCTTTGIASTAVWTTVAGQSTSIFAGGNATGTVNAQVVASTTPAGFAKTPGQVVTFIGLNNTGATTLNVDGTGVSAVNKNTGSGNIPLTGGELNGFVSVIWTGTVYLLNTAILGTLATLNIGQWLKNDGAGNLTIKNGALLGDDGSGNFTILATAVTAGSYTRTKLTVNAEGQLTAAANGAFPTYTRLTSGTGLYTTPAGAKRLYIRMVGGGGGGGPSGGTSPANGGNGTQTSFGSTTANGGVGGQGGTGSSAGAAGAGGNGGSTATGTEIYRTAGSNGGFGQYFLAASLPLSGAGGASPFGANGSVTVGTVGQNAGSNTGSGGGGGSIATSSIGGGGGGGSGEYVEFFINSPAANYNYTVGAGGAAGTSTGGASGGAGAAGVILIQEFYD